MDLQLTVKGQEYKDKLDSLDYMTEKQSDQVIQDNLVLTYIDSEGSVIIEELTEKASSMNMVKPTVRRLFEAGYVEEV